MPKYNSFILFCSYQRDYYKIMFPDRNNSELTGLLAQTWRTLTEEEKSLYAEEAKALNLQHQKQFPKKKKTNN